MTRAAKEHPILFSAPMVRALLDGSKTQTRRIVKPQPGAEWAPVVGAYHPIVINKAGEESPGAEIYGASDEQEGRKCPYGQPGDRLWVRETWGVVSNVWDSDGNLAGWSPDRPATAIHEMPFGQGYYSGHAIYAADGSYEWAGDDDGGGEPRSAWHPSIHMPRIASRILLEIVSVRVERLQRISDADAQAEGAKRFADIPMGMPSADPCRWSMESPANTGQCLSSAKWAFANLFCKVNGKNQFDHSPWDDNPWVWVIDFKRIAPAPREVEAA